MSTGAETTRPNILFFHVDNLGMGELGCYGGGEVRGAPTHRIDRFAREGLQLWHYIAEPQCTPSRSALMTGRHAIRSGTHTGLSGGASGGIVAWERTIADILSEHGYATSCYGKWHIGAEDGRWPTDHGFDEWFGPPRSYSECMWLDDPKYDSRRDPQAHMLEGDRTSGVRVRDDLPLTTELKCDIDTEYKRRSVDFMRRAVSDGRPFYVYFNHSLMHFPTIPRHEFRGKSGNGEWADSLLELDHDFGELLEVLDGLDVVDNTIVILAGDNGAEERLLWRGTAGVFEGSYFSSAEGGIRTPCLIRWPSRVAIRSSNEIVHQADMFTTLLKWAACEAPRDRIIDGIDQSAFFLGAQGHSNREGCLIWVGERLHAVKWKNFKVMFVRQKYFDDELRILSTPHVVDLLADPKEREPRSQRYVHAWVLAHTRRLISDYQDSLKQESLIPAGSPIDYVPKPVA